MKSDILIQLWFGNPYHQAHVQKFKKKKKQSQDVYLFNSTYSMKGPFVLWWGLGE